MGARAAARKAGSDKLVGQRLDRYDILHRLASGGMGSVYVARAVAMGGFERLVALKVLHPHLSHEDEFISMFLDEARLAARIRHPNVVGTLDVAHSEDHHFLVMEYVEGDHLAGLLSRAAQSGRQLPLRPALRIIVDALSGLSAAHQLTDARGEILNLVHRDVSPHNVLVGADGISRLTDFGVAKAEYRLSSTREGQFKGKLAYTAPETASQAHAEQRSDLFAMGVVLWEALTAHRLFKAESNAKMLKQLLEEPIPPPSLHGEDLRAFDGVCAQALARPIDQRFQSAEEMIIAIEIAAKQTGGVGRTSEVAQLVRDLAGDKLRQENEAIRAASESIGAEPPKAWTTNRLSAITDPDSRTAVAKTAAAQKTSSRWPWIVAATAVALAAGIAVYFGVIQSPTTVPAQAPDDGLAETTDEVPEMGELEVVTPQTDETTEEPVDEGIADEGVETTTSEEVEPAATPAMVRPRPRPRPTQADDAPPPTPMMATPMMNAADEDDVLNNPYR